MQTAKKKRSIETFKSFISQSSEKRKIHFLQLSNGAHRVKDWVAKRKKQIKYLLMAESIFNLISAKIFSTKKMMKAPEIS